MSSNDIRIVKVGSRRYRVRTGLGGSSDFEAAGAFEPSKPQPTPHGNVGPNTGKSERISINVPRQLHKYIVGTRGSTLDKLRQESHAKITVPPERNRSDLIEIEGLADEREKAQAMITKLVANNMANVPYTHFISLPLSDLDVQRKVGEFQRDVQQRFIQNADCSSFVNPGSLHITIGMLRLLAPADVTKAVEFLKSLGKDIDGILGARPLLVNVGKLATMEPNPSQARIIYTNVDDFDDGGRLKQLCALVRDKFDEAGYIDEKRELKIHVTLVRAKPARDADADSSAGAPAGDTKRGRPRNGFSVNAAPLLKEFGALSFGVCRIGQIQIARRFRHTESGAYENDGALQLA
ncbi:activating signal cointegrator 1 complex subunit [Coemansia sp. RSA 2706]|nr:activating signal cointegrator 1 complex subunit [Coemansia sp. RSA 2708]KAJ2305226.1 activating signal cointegrator 1 complex subunit [Coemansia sp. RSA 2706]KAJ2315142.1 activating signal cointegrator 1 complex subunit [Coemansia sp. RSA 2705]KAJ2370055.1 activating signal cointegrator 1 complex subunit [Coemansia sp. RSA 2610]